MAVMVTAPDEVSVEEEIGDGGDGYRTRRGVSGGGDR